MGNRLDYLFQEWSHLGGDVLLAESDHSIAARPAEQVIAESTAFCRESSRLTWIVLDWLIDHIDELDVPRLIKETQDHGEGAILGLLADAANEISPNYWFLALKASFIPHHPLEVFFRRIAQSPFASRMASEHSLEIFRRWGYLSDELTYLHTENLEVNASEVN